MVPTTPGTASPRVARLSLAAQAGLLAGPFLTMVDSSIVNVALPDIVRQLHTLLDIAQWILSGYLLALAAGLAATAYLARRYGTLRVYFLSMIGFTLTSALCALAPTIGLLIALRALQGALGAPLVPLAMTMLLGDAETQHQLPPAAGILLFLAPALGPTLGGLLLHVGGWPLIFLVNVPFGLIGAFGVRSIPLRTAGQRDPHARFDALGIILLASGLVLATYGATEGPQSGWSSLNCWPYLASGAVVLAAYVLWALHTAQPAVDLKLLRHAQSALANALCALASIVMFAVIFLIPVYMENVQGLSPLVVGLALLPQGLVTGAGTVLGDKLAPHWGVRRSAALGLLLLTLSTAALLLTTLTTPAWVIALILSGRGLAIGLTIQPLLMTMLAGLRSDEVNDANTLFNVAERLGGSIGIPLLATVFSAREAFHVQRTLQALGARIPAGGRGLATAAQLPPQVRQRLADAAVAGFHDTVWLLVALAALGALAALLLRNPKPAAQA